MVDEARPDNNIARSSQIIRCFKAVLLFLQLAGFSFFFLVLTIALHEAVYTSFGIHNLLLTGVERMAGAANFYTNRLLGGTELDFAAADTAGDNFVILGMNSFFHNSVPVLMVMIMISMESYQRILHPMSYSGAL
jgi:hypothetical protein